MKYFIVETGEEIQMGDVISFTCVKELEDGRVTVEKEVEFSEDTAALLIELGIVEEENTEDKDFIDFDEDEDYSIEEFMEDFEALEQRVDNLEKTLKTVQKQLGSLSEKLTALMEILAESKEKKGKKNAPEKK